jgi:hypothetical protein
MNLRPSHPLSVAAALLVLAAAGCTDPTVAPKSTVSETNIWTDQTSYQAFLAKLYGGLILTSQTGPNENCDKCGDIYGIDEGYSEYLRTYWYLQELPTDEAVIGWNDPGVPELNVNSWTPTNIWPVAMYYRVMFQAVMAGEFLRQTTLDKLDARGVGSALKTTIQHYRAEARFLRALSYAHAIDLFGSVPLVTEADPVGGAPPKQVSRDSLYHYVVNELVALRDSLPAKSADTYARATPAAADMLLAELYLNAEVYTGTPHYDLALNAAQSVITAGGYSLSPAFQANFTADNNLSPELIFVAAQDAAHTQTWGGMTFLVHAGCGGANMQASWYGMDYCWGGYRLKQQVFRLFSAGDRRAAYFYGHAQDPLHFDSVISIGDFNHGVAAPKFTNMNSDGVTHGAQLGMVDTDFPIFRLGEAYLIYAEANLRGGGGSAATALGYLNLLRERAFGDATHDFASMASVTLDTILAERSRELLFEAKRRTDLIRFGKFTGSSYLWAWKGGTAGGASIDAHLAVYPLPANELAANPNLTQNPGY